MFESNQGDLFHRETSEAVEEGAPSSQEVAAKDEHLGKALVNMGAICSSQV